MMNEKHIYYHVGLGKAASTFLQKNVFPHFKGIHYVHRNRYKRHPLIVPKLDTSRVLLSRENSQRLAQETAKLAAYYQNVTPIVVLRRHDDWIASQYRRYIKNGGTEEFTGFIDLHNDAGLWKQHELVLYDKLNSLQEIFGRNPYVIFYDQLRDQPIRVIDEIAALLGATYDPRAVPLDRRHRSYSDKQLQVLRRLRPRLLESSPGESKSGLGGTLRFKGRLLASYCIMTLAHFAPNDGYAGKPLIDPSQLDTIRQHYADDWHACLAYANRKNPLHLSAH